MIQWLEMPKPEFTTQQHMHIPINPTTNDVIMFDIHNRQATRDDKKRIIFFVGIKKKGKAL